MYTVLFFNPLITEQLVIYSTKVIQSTKVRSVAKVYQYKFLFCLHPAKGKREERK
jgi:hypothetical protein